MSEITEEPFTRADGRSCVRRYLNRAGTRIPLNVVCEGDSFPAPEYKPPYAEDLGRYISYRGIPSPDPTQPSKAESIRDSWLARGVDLEALYQESIGAIPTATTAVAVPVPFTEESAPYSSEPTPPTPTPTEKAVTLTIRATEGGTTNPEPQTLNYVVREGEAPETVLVEYTETTGKFDHWVLDGATPFGMPYANPLPVVMDRSHELTAVFELSGQWVKPPHKPTRWEKPPTTTGEIPPSQKGTAAVTGEAVEITPLAIIIGGVVALVSLLFLAMRRR
jgi:hypothetical protein